ncbi:MAG: hypothetical protein HY847_10380 [Betaproteobacteria bacterium]|nr:hypothetical protein [Betaproteobacteria bacterium]
MTTPTRAKPESRQATGKRGGKSSTSFKPGRSGNPGGRPKKTEEQRTLEQMCREKTPDALGTVLSIMASGENERNKLAAAQYVIDRGWGKAKQEIEHVGKGGAELSLSVSFVPSVK